MPALLQRISAPFLALATLGTLAGCGVAASRPLPVAHGISRTPHALKTPSEAVPTRLPGIGPRALGEIPPDTRQALIVTGEDKASPKATAIFYERTNSGWHAGGPWPAHNALRGWTEDHHADDLRSPIGVFALTDAGGLLADPGTQIPYTRSSLFTIDGTGFTGDLLAGSFDHVVAINYNRVPGRSPLDTTRPLGTARGGDIWIHVDHNGPTHGCIGLGREHMTELLHALDSRQHPVIVMGDARSLAR
ncbi:L,D-transpeptidase family protein [Streptomyces olivoreticuli]